MQYDVKLIVGECEVEIMVAQQVMSNASPVFRTMFLPGRFAEGCGINDDSPLEVPLEDDQADAMSILCNIFHLRTKLIPRKHITSNTMADLATLVDKYDCATAIQPWPEIWKDHEIIQQETAIVEEMQLSDLGKWIHISAQLGYEDLFCTTTSALIRKASEDDFRSGPLLLMFGNLSQALQERVEAIRRAILNAYQSTCCSLVEDLERGNGCLLRKKILEGTISDVSEGAFDCSSITLGNALIALRDICGEDWRSSQWTGSVLRNYEQMQAIAGKLGGPSRVFPGSRRNQRHKECSLSQYFSDQIKKAHDEFLNGLQLRELGNHVYRSSAMDT